MDIVVEYACDSYGDHTASYNSLIDTEKRKFTCSFKALKFINECTECLNKNRVLDLMGISNQVKNLIKDDSLNTEEEEFVEYKVKSVNYE
jgi:hypothetical protein